MSNKKSGTTFEQAFCIYAHERGFWAHMMVANHNGQPSDVILCKNSTPALIDCKSCERNIFTFDRIEENQWTAMTIWKKAGNIHALFALKLSDEIRLIPYNTIKEFAGHGFKQFNHKQIIENSYTFEEWEARYFGNHPE